MSLKKYGEYALVTGASSGIGREFAVSLAKEGYNLVLIARRQKELDDLAQELKETRGVEVVVYSADLTKQNAIENIAAFTQDIDVGLVVLNAGMQTHGSFVKTPLEDQTKMLELNVMVENGTYFCKKIDKKRLWSDYFLSLNICLSSSTLF